MSYKGAIKGYPCTVVDYHGVELKPGDEVRSLLAPHMTGVVKKFSEDTNKEMIVTVYGTELLVNTECWVKIDI